jgi:hypothetical protein
VLSLHNATIKSSISASTPVGCAKANARRKCRRFPFGGQVPEVQDALLNPLIAVSDSMRLVGGWVAASCDRKIASGLIEGINSLVQAAKVKGGPNAQSKTLRLRSIGWHENSIRGYSPKHAFTHPE